MMVGRVPHAVAGVVVACAWVAGAVENPTKEAAAHSLAALRDVGVGAEIYVLCQNFLLYITLVIITALMQHYYFPDSIKNGQPTGATGGGARRPGGGGGGGDDDDDVEMEPMIDDEGSGAAGIVEAKGGDEDSAAPQMRRSSSVGTLMSVFDDTTSFNQEEMTKREVLTSLGVCCVGLLVSFLVWGVLQERMLTKPYNGDYFASSYGLVFLNRFGGFLISGAMLYVKAPRASRAIAYRFAFPSVSNMLSSWCQYEALKYVSFPTQMLFKCFKLFPIMVMGKVLGNKTYPAYDYAVALCIGVGIAIFSVSTEDLDIGKDSIGEIETLGGTICGIVLLLFFLLFDSFTGQYQARLFNEHPDLSPYHMMFMVNTFSMIFSFVTLVHTHEIEALCEFAYDHADMHIHLIVFSLASTVGQLFIFKTIKMFGPVVFAICMNSRIILSILLSSLIYDHDITANGMFGLVLVFSAIAYRIKRKTDGKGALVKWAGITDAKSMDIFHEWHEHCDM